MLRPACWLRTVELVAAAALSIAGCAAAGPGGYAQPSLQTVEYYPYQVKGYQGSYPQRHIAILLPVDEHKPPVTAGITTGEPFQGAVAVGATENASGRTAEELYSEPLGPIVQGALVESAREAGLIASSSTETAYSPAKYLTQDYVLQSRIVRCWVNKKGGAGGYAGPAWFTEADFALAVTIYKPPFSVPFWQGTSVAKYQDPPLDSPTAGPDDQTAIYDQPGQVLSVAMTRALAGVFNRTGLHTLIIGDQIPPRR